jgi:hypothetical protein
MVSDIPAGDGNVTYLFYSAWRDENFTWRPHSVGPEVISESTEVVFKLWQQSTKWDS